VRVQIQRHTSISKTADLTQLISCAHSVEPWRFIITTIDSFITCELPTAEDLVPRTLLRAVPDSMQQNTALEAKSRCVSKQMPHLLWNTIVHYQVHRSCHRSLLWARSIHSTHYLSQCNSNILPAATTEWPFSCLSAKRWPHARARGRHIPRLGTGNGRWMELDKVSQC
jgi:hypothetical protein